MKRLLREPVSARQRERRTRAGCITNAALTDSMYAGWPASITNNVSESRSKDRQSSRGSPIHGQRCRALIATAEFYMLEAEARDTFHPMPAPLKGLLGWYETLSTTFLGDCTCVFSARRCSCSACSARQDGVVLRFRSRFFCGEQHWSPTDPELNGDSHPPSNGLVWVHPTQGATHIVTWDVSPTGLLP